MLSSHPRPRSRWLNRPTLTFLFVVTCLVSLAAPGLLTHASTAHASAPAGYTLPYNNADFKTDVIYQVVLDRFFDGNSSNNGPSGDTGLYDGTKANWKLYWGGDLAGLTQKITYLAGMGVTALWLSPTVDNVHIPVYTPDWTGPQAGYHGYWARDFYKIDPHLGTWTDFDTLVTTAHNNGMKVIIDFAPNHSNPNDTGTVALWLRGNWLNSQLLKTK